MLWGKRIKKPPAGDPEKTKIRMNLEENDPAF